MHPWSPDKQKAADALKRILSANFKKVSWVTRYADPLRKKFSRNFFIWKLYRMKDLSLTKFEKKEHLLSRLISTEKSNNES